MLLRAEYDDPDGDRVELAPSGKLEMGGELFTDFNLLDDSRPGHIEWLWNPPSGHPGGEVWMFVTATDGQSETEAGADCIVPRAPEPPTPPEPPVTPPPPPPPANNPPTISLGCTPPAFGGDGAFITLQVTASDPEDGDLTNNVELSSPQGGRFENQGGGTYYWYPPAGFSGGVSFEATVRDNEGLTAEAKADCRMPEPPNKPPKVKLVCPDSPFEPQKPRRETWNRLYYEATDPDGDPITIRVWVEGPGDITIRQNGDIFEWQWTGRVVGNYTFHIEVTDSAGNTARDSCSFEIC